MCCGGMAGSVNAAGALRNWNVIILFLDRREAETSPQTVERFVKIVTIACTIAEDARSATNGG